MIDAMQRRHLVAAGLLSAVQAPAWAQQDYPSRPVQLVHGFGPGGNADVVARLLANRLQAQLRQAVVVEIRSGAGGSIANGYVAQARPDGHTLVMLTGAHTVSAALNRKLSYQPVNDFTFITTVSTFPFVVAVRAEHPARGLADLLALARRDTGRISFTSVGIGSTQHMVGELLASSAGIKLTHVPYRGGGAPAQAVLAGDVDLLVDTPTVALPHLRSGALRALAVTSASPWPALPSVTPASAALPGFEVRSWLGLAAPAGTPTSIVNRLHAEVQRAALDSEFQRALAQAGSQESISGPAAMRDMVDQEILRWRGVIAKAGIVVD